MRLCSGDAQLFPGPIYFGNPGDIAAAGIRVELYAADSRSRESTIDLEVIPHALEQVRKAQDHGR